MCIFVYACVHVCICVYACVCVHVWLCVYVCVRLCLSVCVCEQAAPGMVPLGPLHMILFMVTPLTAFSSLQVPSGLVACTYTNCSWWMVTIWETEEDRKRVTHVLY